MPRVSKKEKQASYEKIVSEASRQYREKGIDATGIAEIMKAVGMTHGGFYRHFASKEELVCTAISKVFVAITTKLENDIDQKGAPIAVKDYVDAYLSQQHADAIGQGCPIAALAIEAGRGPEALKKVFSQGTIRITNLLANAFSGTPEQAFDKSSGLLTGLVGTIIMARSAPAVTNSKAILIAGRNSAYRQLGV